MRVQAKSFLAYIYIYIITTLKVFSNTWHVGPENVFCQSKVLEYMHTELFPKAGVLDTDRALLKEAACDHAAYRAHSGDGDITWQARMQKSGIQCFQLVEVRD